MTHDQLDALQRSVFKSASQIQHLKHHAEKTGDTQTVAVLKTLAENCQTYSMFIEDLMQNHQASVNDGTTLSILNNIQGHCEQVSVAFDETCKALETE